MNALLLFCAVALAAPAAAEPTFEESCANERSLLCPSATGAALAACLSEHDDNLLKGCRDAVKQWGDDERKRQAAAAAKAFVEKAAASVPPVSEAEARLVNTTGAVFLKTFLHPDGHYVKAEAGMPLEPGDLLRTGPDGSAEIAWEGEGLVVLGPSSDFAVELMGKDKSRLFLGYGKLAAKIRKLAQGRVIELASPTALAVVRGTELAMEETEGGTARVGVLDEGRLFVTGAQGGAEVELKANQETQIFKGKNPDAPKPLEALKAHKPAVAAARKRHQEIEKNWKARAPEERLALRRELALKPLVAAGSAKLDAAHAKRAYAHLKPIEAPAPAKGFNKPRKGKAPQLGPIERR